MRAAMKSARTILMGLALLILTACQGISQFAPGTAVPDSPEGFPTLAPTPAPGLSRNNPLPPGESFNLANWEIQVIETMRGDEAWEQIRRANQFNEPPLSNEEYLLVRYHVQNKSRDPEKAYLGLHVTGDNLVLHYSFDAGLVEPEPSLETDLPGGSESEGWVAYRIWQGESNLMVVAESLLDYEEPVQFLALDEGASISASRDALDSIQATEAGMDPDKPVAPGQLATTEDWQVMVLETVTGEAAWNQVYEANQFNEPPPDKMMYVVVKVRVKYIGWQEDGVNISDSSFSLMGGDGVEYETPSIVSPEPELFFDLYPGGSVDGYLVLQGNQEDGGLMLVFDPTASGDYETRYLLLGIGGR